MRSGCASFAAGIAVAILSMPSQAQVPCDQRAKIINILLQQFDERQVGSGLTPSGQMLELFASATKGSWTILLSLPTGKSCLLATGEDWQGSSEKAPAPGNAT